jgi:hypothetical protein
MILSFTDFEEFTIICKFPNETLDVSKLALSNLVCVVNDANEIGDAIDSLASLDVFRF